MTFEKLAQMVADDFNETVNEFGFDSFKEMAKCYCWDSADIKEEVDGIIRAIGAYIDELDGSLVIMGDSTIEYRVFSRMWRKLIK